MRNRLVAALLLLCAAAPAPSSYDAVCPGTCSTPDGATHAAGTVLYRFLWDGQTAYTPMDSAGVSLMAVPDSGQTVPVYIPTAPAQTTIAPLDFMARLTPAEQTAITTAGQSNASVMLFLLKLAGAQTVDVTDPLTVSGVSAMVGASLLTQPRAAQILDLSQASP